jgi:hypothetical protein
MNEQIAFSGDWDIPIHKTIIKRYMINLWKVWQNPNSWGKQ